MFFQQGLFGINKCRLLGNSSFHVHQKEGPYERKKDSPNIPFIEDDKSYLKKYIPKNPDSKKNNPDSYLNFSYCLIDFAKQKVNESNEQFSDLEAEYIVTPCFPKSHKDK